MHILVKQIILWIRIFKSIIGHKNNPFDSYTEENILDKNQWLKIDDWI